MQTTIKKYSELFFHDDYRWDGEYLCFEPYKNPKLKYVPIGDILIYSQYGISIKMNEEGDGTKIYRMNEISNMFCDRNVNKYAKISQHEINEFKLKDRDVIFNRTNSQTFVGRTGIFRVFSKEDYVFASYLIRIRPDYDQVLPEYLTAFLNTKYGIQDVKRRARISINQSNVNAEELKRVEIPILCWVLQKKIKDVFDNAFLLINKSEQIYRECDTLFLSELGLFNWKPKHQLTFVKNFSDARQAERMDAEYFQPKYDKMLYLIQKNAEYVKKICDIESFNRRGIQPRYFNDGEINVITSKHILEYTLDYGNFDKTIEQYWKNNKKAQVRKNDILIYTTGANIGRTSVYLENERCLASNHVNILRLNQENQIYVGAVLNSIIGRLQTEKLKSGAAQAELYPSDISNFIIPFVKKDIQNVISQCVIEGYQLKKQSKHLLEAAKRAVEIAIEEDEDTAMEWLNKEMEGIDA